MASVTARQLLQVRGALLGLVLGDAIGATGGGYEQEVPLFNLGYVPPRQSKMTRKFWKAR